MEYKALIILKPRPSPLYLKLKFRKRKSGMNNESQSERNPVLLQGKLISPVVLSHGTDPKA